MLAGQGMRVSVGCRAEPCVAEDLLDGLHVLAGGQEQTGGCVAQVVKANGRQAGPGEERLEAVMGKDRPAERRSYPGGEDQFGVLPRPI